MRLIAARMFHMSDKNSRQTYRPETPESIEDMLRYDSAFWNPNCPASVLFVHLAGGPQGTVTHDRWLSFGIRLESSERGKHDILENVLPEAEDWVTFQHPYRVSGGPDYSKLVPVTLKEFLEAKTLREIRKKIR